MTSGVTIIQFGLDLKVTKKLQFFKIFQAKISIFFIELPLTGKSWIKNSLIGTEIEV